MTTARRLLLAFTLVVGAVLAQGATPASAQFLKDLPTIGNGDGDAGGGGGLGSLICGYGRMQVCAQESTKSCSQWGVKTKINVTLTGFGVEQEPYCLVEVTTIKWFYRNV